MAEEIPFRREMDFEYGVPRELAPGVRRLVANNPSPFTYKGTNTYILGQGDDLAVIDPGPDDDAHFAATMAAIGKKRVATVIITHTHRDHTDGMPDIVLADGAGLQGDGFALTALHTPGHAPDHLCFALEGTSLLFSGDHVMSWNTSIVAPPEGNMGAYMRSLDKLLPRTDEVYLPGHGGRLYQPQRVVKAFIIHRRMREQSILECIRDGQATIAEIMPIVYRGLDPRLAGAASLSVAAHVEHLIEAGLVTSTGPSLQQARFSAV